MKIMATDREGIVHEVSWAEDESLMEALRDNGLPVLASCGGQRSCATCHVFLDESTFEKTGPSTGEEEELLEETDCYNPCASRLSCQVAYDPGLAGIALELAPEE
ncbi:MAG: 2Fe-2S iron-sulfur cluster-binding protein [Microbacteriaceae bacterium]